LRLTRRLLVRTGMLAALSPVLRRLALPVAPASAQEREWRHGLSLFGELK